MHCYLECDTPVYHRVWYNMIGYDPIVEFDGIFFNIWQSDIKQIK